VWWNRQLGAAYCGQIKARHLPAMQRTKQKLQDPLELGIVDVGPRRLDRIEFLPKLRSYVPTGNVRRQTQGKNQENAEMTISQRRPMWPTRASARLSKNSNVTQRARLCIHTRCASEAGNSSEWVKL
jgi:hypothetical protein